MATNTFYLELKADNCVQNIYLKNTIVSKLCRFRHYITHISLFAAKKQII